MCCNLEKRNITQLEIPKGVLKIYWLFCEWIKFWSKFDSQFFELVHRHNLIWRNHLVMENFAQFSFLIQPSKFALLQTWLHSFAQSFYNLARKISILISHKTERSSTVNSCLFYKFLVTTVPDTKRMYTGFFCAILNKVKYIPLIIVFTICK